MTSLPHATAAEVHSIASDMARERTLAEDVRREAKRIASLGVRVALDGDSSIYVDLGGSSGECVSLTDRGWNIGPRNLVPVMFFRPPGSQQLPRPVTGAPGRFDHELIAHLNMPAVVDWHDADDLGVQAVASTIMVMAGAVYPVGGIPLMIVDGPNGSGKSTFADRIKSLIDPTGHGRGTPSRSIDDVILVARSQYCSIFDNLSDVRGDLSDILCAISTGTTTARRTLYTTGGVSIFAAKRPLVLTTINPAIAGRADLLDRAVKVTLVPITARQTERQLNANWEAARPVLLGLWFDAVCSGLRLLPAVSTTIKPEDLPRHADAAQFAEAVAQGLGWKPGVLLHALAASKRGASTDLLESDPFAVRIRLIVRRKGTWRGSLAELADEVRVTGHSLSMPQNFTYSPKAVAERLTRQADLLERTWSIKVEKRAARGRNPSEVVMRDLNAANPAIASSSTSGGPNKASVAT